MNYLDVLAALFAAGGLFYVYRLLRPSHVQATYGYHDWENEVGHGLCMLGMVTMLSPALLPIPAIVWTWVLGVIKVGAISTSNAPVGSKAAVAAAKGKQAAAHAEQAKKVADAYKAMVVQLEADLKKMQGELEGLRDGVSGQIIAMQVAEEKRLKGLLAANTALTPVQIAGAKAILGEMDDLRTDFKNYDGPPNAAVTLVSKWKARREAAEVAVA